jgi:hypothetical protein
MNVVALKQPVAFVRPPCPACGAKFIAGCTCGTYTPPRLLVIEAIRLNPGMTAREIARHIGVDHKTVAKARKAVGEKSPTEAARRTGKDGKTYAATKSRGQPAPRPPSKTPILDKARQIVRPLIARGQRVAPRKLQKEHGISHCQFETAAAVERALLQAQSIGTPNLPNDQQVDIAVNQIRQQLESQFDDRIKAEFRLIMARRHETAGPASNADRWRLALSIAASEATVLMALWDKDFTGWRELSVPGELVAFAEQAAAAWQQISADLKRRRQR